MRTVWCMEVWKQFTILNMGSPITYLLIVTCLHASSSCQSSISKQTSLNVKAANSQVTHFHHNSLFKQRRRERKKREKLPALAERMQSTTWETAQDFLFSSNTLKSVLKGGADSYLAVAKWQLFRLVWVLTSQSCLGFSVTVEWDVGGGARSLCTACAPSLQSSCPLEYGLWGAAARLSLHGGLDWVPSFSGHPTETPVWEDAENPLGSQGWIIDNVMKASHSSTRRRRVKENQQRNIQGDSGRGVVSGMAGGLGLGSREAEAASEAELRHCITANHELSWKTRGKLGNLLRADFLFREKIHISSGNKCPNDSCELLERQPKLSRGSREESQQQTQRSARQAAKAASAARRG